MNRKKVLITAVIALTFMIVNIVLIVNDRSHRVDRVTFISDWTLADQKDMKAELQTSGVMDYVEEELIYMDDSTGSFREFLVDEGDEVQAGDELYSYDVHNFYEMKAKLDAEEERLQDDIKAVKEAVNKMRSKNINQDTFRFVYPDNKEAGTIKQNTSSAEMMKEQYVIEKEKELAEKEAELGSVQSQIQDLTVGKPTIVVESPYAGKVTHISKSLDNPIISIEAPELYVIGELNESERMKVQEGMFAEITLKENNQKFTGSVGEVNDEPEQVLLKGESIYPFHVLLDDEDMTEDSNNTVEDNHDSQSNSNTDANKNNESQTDENADADTDNSNAAEEENNDEPAADESDNLTKEDLLQGYHADMLITLDESPEAAAVPDKLAKGNFVWLMTASGKLVKQPIIKGIDDSGYTEITNGAIIPNDRLATKPEQHFRDQSDFITPLKPSKSNWKAIYKDAARKRSLLIGLLGR